MAVLAELVAIRAAGGIAAGVLVAEPQHAIDPVCGMSVDVATARFEAEHEGISYHFCAAGCQKAFEADPEGFAVAPS